MEDLRVNPTREWLPTLGVGGGERERRRVIFLSNAGNKINEKNIRT